MNETKLGETEVIKGGNLQNRLNANSGKEYWLVRRSDAGLIDLSARGRIRVRGSEAVQFLNGLVSNDLNTLPVHRWLFAAFPNVQGRLVALVRIMRLADEPSAKTPTPVFLIDTEAATQQKVLRLLERFTLAGDFRVNDVTEQTAMISLQGKNASRLVNNVLGKDLSELEQDGAAELTWEDKSVTIFRATHTAEDGFDIVVDPESAKALMQSFHAAGAQPVGAEALEVLRIEAGIPAYGIDMDESHVVPETGLDQAISYTKGCYLGQEIIARIKYRGHVAKKLAGLQFSATQQVDAGAELQSTEGKKIGQITSAVYSPTLDATIALGYVKFDYLQPGTELKISGESLEGTGKVVDLPFVRGSWYTK